MFKFFRNIRLQLLRDDKPRRYLKYALGEILLVVIGILIALQINIWNETRKQHNKTNFYIAALIVDLTENLKFIQSRNNSIKKDLATLQSYNERLRKPTATIDTVVKISSEEIDIMFYTFKKFSDNTYQTLQSTGDIEFLDRWLLEELQELNTLEKDLLKTNDNMSDDYSRVLIDFIDVYIRGKNRKAISKHLADKVLASRSETEKLSALNSYLMIKGGIYHSFLRRSEPLEEKTSKLIDSLRVVYPFVNN